MEPIALRYFREVAAHGSVRHAAERMFVAQSAVSRQVAMLESELGVPLFERRARGMALTEAGRLLLAYTQEAKSRFEELRGVIRQYESLARGHVEIASVEGLLTSFLPESLREFSETWPGISLGVASLGSQAVAEGVAEHRYELGIVFGAPPRADLVELARMPQPLYAAVAPTHALARRKRCTLADVVPFPVVLPDRSFVIRQMIDRVCAARKLTLARSIETNTLAFAQSLVMGSSSHVTFLPLDLLAPAVKLGALAALKLEEPGLQERQCTLVASRTRTLSNAARHLAGWMGERMKAKRHGQGGRRSAF